VILTLSSRSIILFETIAQKADEAQRKYREKQALLAAEEEQYALNKITREVGAGMKAKNARNKKKQGDLALLEDSLVSLAEKKTKAVKRAELVKKEKEDREALGNKSSTSTNYGVDDTLVSNTVEILRGTATFVNTNGEVYVGSSANRALGTEHVAASGLDAALGQLSLSINDSNNAHDNHPEKRLKALHKAFEERMLPIMKTDYPGLKQSQYKERIFKLWQKSPENPLNWSQVESSRKT